MDHSAAKVRLFIDAPLAAGLRIEPDRAQANYLFAVMRLAAGDCVALFNGRDGEWRAEIVAANKRGGALICRDQSRPQAFPPDIWLLFAPLKKSRTDFIAEKAAEMGCSRLLPVFTRFTNSERVNVERLRAHAVEAAEQCELLRVPRIAAPQKLEAVLEGWSPQRRLMFCDEARDAPGAARMLRAEPPGAWAILIGPEGGFAPEERMRLRDAPFSRPVSLGPRVLRADTAAVAALSLWQSIAGDW